MIFSLIIASKNEEEDIHLAIESSINQTYKNKEILVVDDSSDRTREIVNGYSHKGVRLIKGKNHGCCEARNLGINNSIGDVIVFLTADTILKPDYLQKISLEYQDTSLDMLTVRSEASNLTNYLARFIDNQSKKGEDHPHFNPFTTQGYSVRKKSAKEVGLISGEPYPFNFCRDWTLGEKLYKNKYNLKHLKGLVVYHKAPQDLLDYWTVRKTRGLMSAYQPYYFFGKKLPYLFFKFMVKSLISLFKILLLFPVILDIYSLTKYSKNRSDFFLFIFPYLVQEYAFRYGEFKGLFNILRKNKIAKN